MTRRVTTPRSKAGREIGFPPPVLLQRHELQEAQILERLLGHRPDPAAPLLLPRFRGRAMLEISCWTRHQLPMSRGDRGPALLSLTLDAVESNGMLALVHGDTRIVGEGGKK